MILRAALLALALLPGASLAQTGPDAAGTTEAAAPDARAVAEALALPEVIDVMAREGQRYGEDVAAQVFGDAVPPPDWAEAVAAIYDPARMEAAVMAALEEGLAGEDAAAMLAFLEAEPGRGLFRLELAAREAMLDEDVEQAAKEAAAVAMAEDSARLALLRRYAEATDLIETNVASALNSQVAYYMGLLDGGAMGAAMTESDVLADVAAQEARVRADTTEWLYAFLLMAYGPASDADIEALIAFSETGPGRALNRATYVAFDRLFADVSRALGLASARFLTTQEI